ncbi:hypothetical protein QTP88_006364 [Uroleucon formosanum]
MYFEHVLRVKTSETSGKRRDGYDPMMGIPAERVTWQMSPPESVARTTTRVQFRARKHDRML